MKKVMLNIVMSICCVVAIYLVGSFNFDVDWIFEHRSHEYLMWSCRYQGFLVCILIIGTVRYAKEAYDYYQIYVEDRDRNVL